MKKILAFLIQFMNETDLQDHVELTFEPDGENPERIVIRRVLDDSESTENPF